MLYPKVEMSRGKYPGCYYLVWCKENQHVDFERLQRGAWRSDNISCGTKNSDDVLVAQLWRVEETRVSCHQLSGSVLESSGSSSVWSDFVIGIGSKPLGYGYSCSGGKPWFHMLPNVRCNIWFSCRCGHHFSHLRLS